MSVSNLCVRVLRNRDAFQGRGEGWTAAARFWRCFFLALKLPVPGRRSAPAVGQLGKSSDRDAIKGNVSCFHQGRAVRDGLGTSQEGKRH